jgi:hypothetical protein
MAPYSTSINLSRCETLTKMNQYALLIEDIKDLAFGVRGVSNGVKQSKQSRMNIVYFQSSGSTLHVIYLVSGHI